jgi:hypothetical protein
MSGFLHSWANPGEVLQHPFQVAVVIPSILRPEIATALRSVFAQDLDGRIQVLIGVDRPGDIAPVEAACADRPGNCTVQLLWPGYSTSARHGGITAARDGGALRNILSLLANSPYVAYLDDDNWWRPDHLRLLYQQMLHADWAFSLRWFVHPESRRPICIDEWESVGPGKGFFKDRFNGFADPNTLMLNKLVCADVLPYWNQPLPQDATGMSADRTVFDALMRRHQGATSGEPTCFYTMNANDGIHPQRLALFGDAYAQAGA